MVLFWRRNASSINKFDVGRLQYINLYILVLLYEVIKSNYYTILPIYHHLLNSFIFAEDANETQLCLDQLSQNFPNSLLESLNEVTTKVYEKHYFRHSWLVVNNSSTTLMKYFRSHRYGLSLKKDRVNFSDHMWSFN